MPVFLVVSIISGFVALILLQKLVRSRRDEFIRTFSLPQGLYEKLRQKHPQLTQKDCELVGHALRQFFHSYLRSGREEVAMPSQVVDDLWHEFILYTRSYASFCRRAFGKFLHHTPAAVMTKSSKANMGLRRCWWQACRDEHINPQRPTRLPLLFAIDRKLFIANGFLYVLDCGNTVETGKVAAATAGAGLPVYCASDLKPLKKDRSDGSSCSSGGSCSGGGSSCAGSGGHGNGCSGSGCSGGCGGD